MIVALLSRFAVLDDREFSLLEKMNAPTPQTSTNIQNNFSTRQPHRPHPKSKFSPEEDLLLRQLVMRFGDQDWTQISSHMIDRNKRQCKERWSNYLNPSIRNGPWTPEEDRLLEEMYKEYGSKWVRIAQHFNSRTDTNVKNRWLVLSRRNKKEEKPFSTMQLSSVHPSTIQVTSVISPILPINQQRPLAALRPGPLSMPHLPLPPVLRQSQKFSVDIPLPPKSLGIAKETFLTSVISSINPINNSQNGPNTPK